MAVYTIETHLNLMEMGDYGLVPEANSPDELIRANAKYLKQQMGVFL